MRQSKEAIILLLLFFLTQSGWSQKRGYIVKDSIYTQGFILDRGQYSNNRYILFHEFVSVLTEDKDFIRFSPEGLSEFSFDNKKYRSRQITDNLGYSAKRFLLLLSDGKIALYAFKTRKGQMFFIEDSTRLSELKKDNYKQVIAQFTNVEDDEVISRIRFNRNSLTNFSEDYNNGDREIKLKKAIGVNFGPLVGLSRNGPSLGENNNSRALGWSNSINLGGFLKLSRGEESVWDFRTEILYGSASFSRLTEVRMERNRNFLLSYKSIAVPVYLNYSIRGINQLNLFVNAGLVNQFFVQSEARTIDMDRDEDTVFLVFEDAEWNTYALGGLIGLGNYFNIGLKNDIGFEFRFTYSPVELFDGRGNLRSFGFMINYVF